MLAKHGERSVLDLRAEEEEGEKQRRGTVKVVENHEKEENLVEKREKAKKENARLRRYGYK